MTTPLQAATVLVLRQAAGDIEVLMVRRGHKASFMANSYVFPGGRVDPADALPDPALATRRCAARELAEEAGLHVGDLGPAELVYFAQWVTPTHEPKRFDTAFFLWAMPPGQTPVVDAREVFDLQWLTPQAALQRYAEGALNLPPPTVCTLEDLQAEWAAVRGAAGVNDPDLLPRLLAACQNRRPQSSLPKLTPGADGGIAIVMPWDPSYAELPGEGETLAALAVGAAPVPTRINRCLLNPPGGWQVVRAAR